MSVVAVSCLARLSMRGWSYFGSGCLGSVLRVCGQSVRAGGVFIVCTLIIVEVGSLCVGWPAGRLAFCVLTNNK